MNSNAMFLIYLAELIRIWLRWLIIGAIIMVVMFGFGPAGAFSSWFAYHGFVACAGAATYTGMVADVGYMIGKAAYRGIRKGVGFFGELVETAS